MSYTIESIVENCKGKNIFQMIDYLNKNISFCNNALLNMKRMGNISEYQIKENREYSEALLLYLTNSIIPSGFSIQKFKVFKPLISQLVDDGMSSYFLGIFDNHQ